MASSTHSLFKKSDPPPGETPPSRSSRWINRLATALPILLLIGFGLLAWLLFGDRLLPAPEVTVAPVVTLKATADTSTTGRRSTATPAANGDPYTGDMLFQASGWIEADPFLIRATALTDGVVRDVHVLEGETVEQGQPLATLIQEDARLRLADREADREAARAAVARAEASLAEARAGLTVTEARTTAARARLAELEDEADRLARAGVEAVQARQIEQAALRVDAQAAEVSALEARLQERTARIAALETGITRARSLARRAEVLRDEAALALERTVIRSPINGVIQQLHAEPGKKKLLGMDDLESATIAILYQPERLQARIDVPLETAAQLKLGQPARIRTNLLPETVFKARVTRIVGQADLQRNTLQAKVALLDPDPRLRPEMLCRAEFLPADRAGANGSTAGSTGRRGSGIRLFAPEAGLIDRQGREARAWVLVDDGDRLARRTLRLGTERRNGHIEVLAGLQPGDRLVLNPAPDLATGDRVAPRPHEPANPE
ncbi:MAG: efflux RND transporter periplasmic adaptor subunit [Opitutales bacterium]